MPVVNMTTATPGYQHDNRLALWPSPHESSRGLAAGSFFHPIAIGAKNRTEFWIAIADSGRKFSRRQVRRGS